MSQLVITYDDLARIIVFDSYLGKEEHTKAENDAKKYCELLKNFNRIFAEDMFQKCGDDVLFKDIYDNINNKQCYLSNFKYIEDFYRNYKSLISFGTLKEMNKIWKQLMKIENQKNFKLVNGYVIFSTLELEPE